jgi:hypothetical protein
MARKPTWVNDGTFAMRAVTLGTDPTARVAAACDNDARPLFHLGAHPRTRQLGDTLRRNTEAGNAES